MNKKIIISVVVIALVLLGTFMSTQNKTAKFIPTPTPTPILTTTPTPSPEIQHPDWQTFTDPTITFKYPGTLQTKYIHTQNWPPKITVSSDKFSCKVGGQKTIGDTTFCIEDASQGAAGTIYSDYTYTFLKQNKLITLQFTLGYPQCGNYEEAQMQACQKERQTFDLDNLINEITQTIKLQSVKSDPVITSPQANSKISSPLTVKGTVPAGWMFEGVFPIKLLDENKKLISQAQAKEVIAGSWSTGKDVEFTATLNYSTTTLSGFLVIEKDNPSGLPANASSYEIPVKF